MKYFSLKIYCIVVIIVLINQGATAQVKIGDNPTSIDANSLLELESGNKGVLMPRVALTSTTSASPLLSHVTGMVVYNTAMVADVTPGFYFNIGSAWVATYQPINHWSFLGNAGTTDSMHFIGTTDNVPLNFRVNNQKAGKIAPSGATFFGYQSGNNNVNNYITGIGYQALFSNTEGYENTGIGYQSLFHNTTGNYNTANGVNALYHNTTANANTANGYQSLYFNSTGGGHTASGYRALYSNTTGYYNTASGYLSLYSNTTGHENTANGFLSLYYNTTGNYNTCNGKDAMHYNVAGSNGTAVGFGAMYYANNSSTPFTNYNVAVGFEALRGSTTPSNNTGNSNTAFGYQTLWSNTTGNYNSANGFRALYSNTIGDGNTANGISALYSNTSGNYNTAYGSSAFYFNTTGNNNTANGYRSLYANTTGNNNIAIGTNALYSNVAGSNATAIGYNAMRYSNNSAKPFTNRSVAVGYEALYNGGNYNTAIGYQTLWSNTSGFGNSANGYWALYSNTGSYNTASGYFSLYLNTSGGHNTAFGQTALGSNTTGSYNTACGWDALYSNTTGTYNSAFGTKASFDLGTLDNTTCIGQYAGGFTEADNRIEIGNSSVTWIGGQVAWSTYSDARIKDNVMENVPGLAFINRLRPVTYNLNIHKVNEMVHTGKKEEGEWDSKYDIEKIRMTGFIAQEVEQAAKEVGYDFSGMEKPQNENELYSIRYSEFVVPLVKAIQEQQAQIEDLKKENSELRTGYDQRLDALQQQIIALQTSIQGLKERQP